MIIIIVFLDFLYIFLDIGGRGRITQFFLGFQCGIGPRVNVGFRGDIVAGWLNFGLVELVGLVELGGGGEMGHWWSQGSD